MNTNKNTDRYNQRRLNVNILGLISYQLSIYCISFFLWLSIAQAQTVYPLSTLREQLIINEVLFKQSAGNTIAENDEFIELYNASNQAIDLTQIRLIDGNLFTGQLDGTVGSITGNTSSFNFNCTGSQQCTGPTLLAPQAYAVIWVGQNNQRTQAPHASFQAWLQNAPKLNDSGDDVWLYEQTGTGLALIDYLSYGSGSAVNTAVATDIWDFAYNADLASASKGQSLSLSPNGQLSSSACWEPTTSAIASSTCSTYIATQTSDALGTRLTSQGDTNTALQPTDPHDGTNYFTLTKSVWNVSQQRLGDSAKPNDVLRYQLSYTNKGNTPLHDVVIHDAVPAFTRLVNTPQCLTTPSALGTCQVDVENDLIAWKFTGQLNVGDTGEVIFEVQVE